MNELAKLERGEITEFNPERHRLKVAALDYGIEEAKRIKDWPVLEKAVDGKIEEQGKFIVWRNGNIRGVGQPQKNGDCSVTKLSDQQITDISGVTKKQAERIADRLIQRDEYREYLLGTEYRAAHLEGNEDTISPRTIGTGNDEWFTPSQYIELARKVLGEIDLDPASCDAAQETVRAKRFFNKQYNGLNREWGGKVWLNPPYSQSAAFITKLCEEYSADRVSAAVLLTHNFTDSKWFHEALEVSSGVCLTRGRIKFIGAGNAPPCGQAFFYFGANASDFAGHFIEIGSIVAPYVGTQ